MPPTFDLIGLVVKDMAVSLAFYRELGLEIPHEADGEGHVETTLPGGTRIAWDTVEIIHSFDESWKPPIGGHRVSLAFRCDSPAEVDRTFERLIEAGHRGHMAPWDAYWGQRYATVLDPEGNPVDLFAGLG